VSKPRRAWLRGSAPRQEAVEVIGKAPPVTLAERRWTAQDRTGRAQVLHEIPEGQTLADVVLGVQLSPRVERVRSPRDHLGGKGNVGRDDQILRLHLSHDPMVRDVEAVPDPDAPDEA